MTLLEQLAVRCWGLCGPDAFEVTTDRLLSFNLSCQVACVPSATSSTSRPEGRGAQGCAGWLASPRGAERRLEEAEQGWLPDHVQPRFPWMPSYDLREARAY